MKDIDKLINSWNIDKLINLCKHNEYKGFFIFGDNNVCVCNKSYADSRGVHFYSNDVVLEILKDFIVEI